MAQQTCNQFEPTTNTSSATTCKWCGQEKFLHALKVDYMTQQTAVDYFKDELIKQGFFVPGGIYAQAKAMEKQQRMQDYNVGYTDAACNHINDAENYANEQDYLNDKEITDYTIGPFGTPENK